MDGRRPAARFGVFEVDLAAGELYKQGLKVKLQEQPFQVLSALIERPREIVTREELQKRLWPDTVVDFDRGLNKAINRLREVLGDDAENPRFIETLPQRGYRFLAPVECSPAEPAPPGSPENGLALRLLRRRGLRAIAGGLIAVALICLGYLRLRSSWRPIESIAVLPLENLSGDPAQEYFSDGITDELIGEIAGISSLRVISRTSVMRYKGRAGKSLPEIARELNVDAIVEGTVVQSGRRVRISAQLIRAEDDRHLWSGKYERDLTDVLALQSEVAGAVAREIRIKLTRQRQTRLARTGPVHAEGYEAFLRGNYFLYKGVPGVAKSIDYFTQAIKLNPRHSDAHAGLAQALVYAAIFGLRPSAEAFPAARRAALKALEIDELNAPAHNALADVKKGYDWDLAGAEAEYQRALQLNPSHLLSRLWYAECLARMRRYKEALEESDRALALDPVSPHSHTVRAMILCRAHRYGEAIRASQQALELDPYRPNVLWWQGLSYAGIREFSKSIDSFTKALSMSDAPLFRALLGHVYGLAGERTKAQRILDELTTLSRQVYVSPVDFAVVYAGLGDANSTFDWLERAYQARAARMHELQWMYFDRFREDPRYSDLMTRVGLPSIARTTPVVSPLAPQTPVTRERSRLRSRLSLAERTFGMSTI
ncbi:MAG: winged helix-turn-helix domain-containing protein [Acidobacteria bacterium]|nr:winged helix-turn-helix domain-containing protein [Acidobacteriota bacterium]